MIHLHLLLLLKVGVLSPKAGIISVLFHHTLNKDMFLIPFVVAVGGSSSNSSKLCPVAGTVFSSCDYRITYRTM